MKKLVFGFLSIFFVSIAYPQDIIYSPTWEKLEVKIVDVSKKGVIFYRWDDPTQTLDTLPRKEAQVGRLKGWLSREELEQANHHIAALHELFFRGKRRRDTQLYAITVAHSRLAPSERDERSAEIE